jgi:hypothetical protein
MEMNELGYEIYTSSFVFIFCCSGFIRVYPCASVVPMQFYGTRALTSAEYTLSRLAESTEVTTK